MAKTSSRVFFDPPRTTRETKGSLATGARRRALSARPRGLGARAHTHPGLHQLRARGAPRHAAPRRARRFPRRPQ